MHHYYTKSLYSSGFTYPLIILTINSSNKIIVEMDDLARELPEYEEINKMPGVGKKLTSRIIAEIGDVRKFKNAGSIIDMQD